MNKEKLRVYLEYRKNDAAKCLQLEIDKNLHGNPQEYVWMCKLDIFISLLRKLDAGEFE